MIERKIVNQRIEYLRTKILCLTQKDFAILLGMNPEKGRSTVNNWEQGAVQVKSDDLEKIAKLAPVSADWLLGISKTPQRTESIQNIHAVTGLSGKAIGKLNRIAKSNHETGLCNVISALIEDENAEFFLSILKTLIDLDSVADPPPIQTEVAGKEMVLSPSHLLQAVLQTLILENIPKITQIFKEMER